MKIKACLEKEEYQDNFPASFPGDFLQSWEWGEIQMRVGYKVKRYILEDWGVLTIIFKPLFKSFCYAYIPRGPKIKRELSLNEREEIISFVKKEALRHKAIFVRWESSFLLSEDYKRIEQIQPLKTLILDLSLTEKDLYSQMAPKGRYNIRLSQKKELVFSENKKYSPQFLALIKQTGTRDNFRTHSESYYHHLLSSKNVFLFSILFKKRVVASGIFALFGKTFYYLHGASSYDHRALMAPYYLQWQAIAKAKKLSCLYYDFYGIDPVRWPGVTRFKKAFGGRELEYLAPQEICLRPNLCRLFYLLKKII